ncbi:MAG: T9SS type A sorting domain-containing protein, partial [Sphingobacteriia bacterium]|nr:T9SS type A sorting domain-containing protein [Sphingobacteriia bacterium]
GLAGCADIRGRIEYSYSTGPLKYNNDSISTLNNNGGNITLFGGLVGNIQAQGAGNDGVVVSSYWDKETSHQSLSAAGTGLSTNDIQTQSNLSGFDFTDVWKFVGSQNDGYPILQDVDLTEFITWTGTINNAWSTSTNWNPAGPPDAADIAVIPAGLENYPIIDGAIITPAKEVDVQSKAGSVSATITITPNGSFTVSNTLRTDPPGIIIESDNSGTGSLVHNSEEVYGTVYRYITGSATLTAKMYHTVSVPLTQSSNPLSGLFLDSYLFSFDASTQDWDAYGTPVDTPLDVDQGYLIYYPSDDPKTYTFTGILNNGTFSASVGYHTANAYTGNNLVPNPYPSAIDWDASSGWTKTNINDAIRIWNPTVGNYAAYVTKAGTNGGTRYIPTGQAFFVRASAPSPALQMTNDVRVHNDQAFFKNQMQEDNLLRIKAFYGNYSDEIVVRFRDGAGINFDSDYDAGKMYGMGGSPQLYSLSGDDQQLSINSIAATSEVVSIPVGFELETDGLVTLEFSGVTSFEPQIPVFLWDQLENTRTDLSATSQYTFTHQAGNEPLRFVLLLNSAVNVEEYQPADLHLLSWYEGNQLNVKLPDEAGKNALLQLYSVHGQLISSQQATDGQASFDMSPLSRGIYIIKVNVNGHRLSEKISY